jgi:hypothetical protein
VVLGLPAVGQPVKLTGLVMFVPVLGPADKLNLTFFIGFVATALASRVAIRLCRSELLESCVAAIREDGWSSSVFC